MKIVFVCSALLLVLSACRPSGETVAPATAAAPAAIPQPSRLPLSDSGPHLAGWRRLVEFVDPADPERKVVLTIWYPAVAPEGTEPWTDAKVDVPPDASAAPYPLVLTATKVAMYFGPHLASHGFVVAGVNGQDSRETVGPWLIDHPRELLFALEQIALQGVSGLEGMIDAEHAAAMGYSFGGPTALTLGGARVDPDNYLSECAQAAPMDPVPQQWYIDYTCKFEGGWDAFAAHAGPEITTTEDGLWAPLTDDRIRAVIPMAPEGAWLFGERGLAAVDRPTLIFGASEDMINYYDLEAIPIYEGIGAAQRSMVSFVGEGHMMIDSPARLAQMQHFTAAFLGLHLKGDESMAAYISEEFVSQYDDLAWGVYGGD